MTLVIVVLKSYYVQEINKNKKTELWDLEKWDCQNFVRNIYEHVFYLKTLNEKKSLGSYALHFYLQNKLILLIMNESIIEDFFIPQHAHKWFKFKCYVHAVWMLEKVFLLEIWIFLFIVLTEEEVVFCIMGHPYEFFNSSFKYLC